jgi:ElaB/YqjD/DUF883 family membrane-anchored ribosome-binding protein
MTFNKDKTGYNVNPSQSPIGDQTNRVLDEAKKLGTEIYEEGKNKVEDLQGNIKENSDKLLQHIQEKPLHSVLIAAGVGFLISHLLRK